jgi:hypothetical protein
MSSYYGLVVQMGWFFAVLFFLSLWVLVVRSTLFSLKNFELVALGATIASGLILSAFESVVYSAGNAFSFLFWVCVMLASRRLAYASRGIRLDRNGALSNSPSLRFPEAGGMADINGSRVS